MLCYSQLPGEEKVKVGCFDLSSCYRQSIRYYFPSAKIVANRFHAICLINRMCIQSYQALDAKTKYQRTIFAILRIKPKNLTAVQIRWCFTKNKGITEGFHRKTKLIHRRAYGNAGK